MQPQSGLRIGPYTLVELIGAGGMGVVWRARDAALDRDVAIKFLLAAFARDPERLVRFEREAKAAAALSHPGILAIYGFGEHEGTAYAVAELLEGQTLRSALGEKGLTNDRIIDIARQVARAITAAHERGITHRDLKPENVFLTRDGHVKILDFGLAALAHIDDGSAAAAFGSMTPTRTVLTHAGAILGTTDYLSPEQVRGKSVDARSDIFSFGSVLYEMIGGRRPFHRETPAETMSAILNDEPLPLSGAPPALQRVAFRCLEKRPEARFASTRDLTAALDAAAAAAPRRTKSPRLVIGSVMTAAVLATLAVVAWKARVVPDTGVVARPPPSVSSIGEVPSSNGEANEYFEKGLFFIRAQLDIPHAQTMFDHAIELDPTFGAARAMRSLTDVIAIHEGFSNDAGLIYAAEGDLRDTLAAEPDLATAHAVLGATLLYLNRTEQAKEELELSKSLNPEGQAAAAWLMILNRHSGLFEEATVEGRRILSAVPLFWAVRIMLSDVLFDAGNIDAAQVEIGKVFEQDPYNVGASRAMARVHIYRGDTQLARSLLEGLSAETSSNYRVRLTWALLLAREGDSRAAIAALDAETLQYAGVALFAPAQVAEVYAVSGRTEEALGWLDRAARNGDERSQWFQQNVLFESIRTQPRFRLILDSIDRAVSKQGSDTHG